jgi:3-oxoacid CoA-transferase B subunit
MADKPKLQRQAMCDRLAMEFQDDWIVNLGVGMPTLCSNYVDPSKDIIYHSENGVIGYGPLAPEGEENPHLVNAGGQNVTSRPGMAIVHHADSFSLIRGGMIDVTVLGAYEVSENGDFANWRIPVRKGGGIGGAMDLAACAKRVFIAMEHTTRDGKSKLLTAAGCRSRRRARSNCSRRIWGFLRSDQRGLCCVSTRPAGVRMRSRS